ncbi:MAG: hypothetical protein QOI33_2094 [Mycobacterium sp.]|nr:hypothetical protein [Mycobacterium sp.]
MVGAVRADQRLPVRIAATGRTHAGIGTVAADLAGARSTAAVATLSCAAGGSVTAIGGNERGATLATARHEAAGVATGSSDRRSACRPAGIGRSNSATPDVGRSTVAAVGVCEGRANGVPTGPTGRFAVGDAMPSDPAEISAWPPSPPSAASVAAPPAPPVAEAPVVLPAWST